MGRPDFNATENSGFVVTFFPGEHENRLVLHYNMNDFAGKGFVLPLDNEWHHIAVVLDTTVKGLEAIKMYLDGEVGEVGAFFLPPPAGVPIAPNDVELKIGCGKYGRAFPTCRREFPLPIRSALTSVGGSSHSRYANPKNLASELRTQ